MSLKAVTMIVLMLMLMMTLIWMLVVMSIMLTIHTAQINHFSMLLRVPFVKAAIVQGLCIWQWQFFEHFATFGNYSQRVATFGVNIEKETISLI